MHKYTYLFASHTLELIIRTYIHYAPIFFLWQLHLLFTLFAIIEIILIFLGINVKKRPAQTAEPPVSVDEEPPVSEPFPFILSTVLLWISSLLSASASTGSNRQPQFLGKCWMCCIMWIVSIMYFVLIILLPVADFLLHPLDKVVYPFLVKYFYMPVWHPTYEVSLDGLEMMAAQVEM